jgi:hypothetical protein
MLHNQETKTLTTTGGGKVVGVLSYVFQVCLMRLASAFFI